MASLHELFFSFLFLLLLLLCSVDEGHGAPCSSADISVRQSRTGSVVEGKPEYEVWISNGCRCLQSKVVLRCYGISSVEPVNRRAIRPVDAERCIVGDGRAISRGTPVRFKYAWMTPQDFPIVSTKIHHCN